MNTTPGHDRLECWSSHPHLACQCGRDKHHDGVHACWCGERWTATNRMFIGAGGQW